MDIAIIRNEEVNVEEVIDKIKNENIGKIGCIVSFIGVVREVGRSEGRVLRLVYEVYSDEALKKMKEIAEEVTDKYGVVDVKIYHKSGEAEVGEETFYVFVAAKHRREAFQALMEIVERVKHEVPIWKKEVTEHGESWIIDNK
jgi:molybdopterin synthase catalytic subunit